MIYVVTELADWSVVKIGYTCSPRERVDVDSIRKRLSGLQVSTWRELVCIAMFDGSREEEARLHWRFKDAHVSGEWFRHTEQINAWMRPRLLETPLALSGADAKQVDMRDEKRREKQRVRARRQKERLRSQPRSWSSVDLYAKARGMVP